MMDHKLMYVLLETNYVVFQSSFFTNHLLISKIISLDIEIYQGINLQNHGLADLLQLGYLILNIMFPGRVSYSISAHTRCRCTRELRDVT